MSPDKLSRMANQIATFFRSQPGQDQAERVWRATSREFLGPRDAPRGAEGLCQGARGSARRSCPPRAAR